MGRRGGGGGVGDVGVACDLADLHGERGLGTEKLHVRSNAAMCDEAVEITGLAGCSQESLHQR